MHDAGMQRRTSAVTRVLAFTMSASDLRWIADTPLAILQGLEASLTVPPRGQELLRESGVAEREEPRPQGDADAEQAEFENAMSAPDDLPRRLALVERMKPHLAVLAGQASRDTPFGRWVIEQGSWFVGLDAQACAALAQWPYLEGVSISQSSLSETSIRDLAAALPRLRKLSLASIKAKNDPWSALDQLAHVEELRLKDLKGVDDRHIPTIMRMPRLRLLALPDASLSSSGLAALASHPSLRQLEVSGMDDQTLIALATAGFSSLRSARSKVTDTALMRLGSDATGLRELHLPTCPKVTDAGAAALASLKGLIHLTVSGSKITDAGATSLSALRALETLDIGSCAKVTDAAVPALSSLCGLKLLRITGTKISPKGMGELGRSLKGCNIATKG